MAGFDRSKIKATPMSVLRDKEAEYATKRPSKNGGFADRLKIEVGTNKFRLMPVHADGGGLSYAEYKCTTFLNVKRPSRDSEGKVIEGQFEVKLFPVFNSKVHGGLSKDLIEEYMKFAKEVAIPEFTKDAKLADLIWKSVAGDFKTKKQGVKPSDAMVIYASKWLGNAWGPIGDLEIPKSVQTQLKDIAISFIGENATASPDPYTDPDEGIAVIIENSGVGSDRYKCSLDQQKIDKFNTQAVPTPLTESQFEEWSKLTPLYKRFVNVFKRSDFDYQIEGLQAFDEELAKQGYPIQVFGYEAFLDIVQEIDSMIATGDEPQGTVSEPIAPIEQPKPTVTVVKPKVIVQAPAKVEQPAAQIIESTAVLSTGENKSKLDLIRAKYKKS